VEVGSESVERDVLLWTAWGVWEAGVVGALEGRLWLVDVGFCFFEFC
jgi:hypothetical protein